MTKLGKPKTIGELKKIIDSLPDNTSFGFRNQPMQELFIFKHGKKDYVFFQEPLKKWFTIQKINFIKSKPLKN